MIYQLEHRRGWSGGRSEGSQIEEQLPGKCTRVLLVYSPSSTLLSFHLFVVYSPGSPTRRALQCTLNSLSVCVCVCMFLSLSLSLSPVARFSVLSAL